LRGAPSGGGDDRLPGAARVLCPVDRQGPALRRGVAVAAARDRGAAARFRRQRPALRPGGGGAAPHARDAVRRAAGAGTHPGRGTARAAVRLVRGGRRCGGGPTVSSDVELTRVSKWFGAQLAVDDVSCAVASGSFFSLLGPSGCGKSTTLRMISGLEWPDAGTLRIAGQDMRTVPANRRPTNMVFQRWALFPHMTVFDNVAFGLTVDKVARDEIKRRVA